eukprot:256180-Prorocentrum_minimum.AAC.2
MSTCTDIRMTLGDHSTCTPTPRGGARGGVRGLRRRGKAVQQVDTTQVEPALKAIAFNSLIVHPFQAIGFKSELAPLHHGEGGGGGGGAAGGVRVTGGRSPRCAADHSVPRNKQPCVVVGDDDSVPHNNQPCVVVGDDDSVPCNNQPCVCE